MTNSYNIPNTQNQQETGNTFNTPTNTKVRKKKAWKKVSSASEYLQFEYSDNNDKHNNNKHLIPNGNKTSSISDLRNYGFAFEDYEYNDMESKNLSHSSTKNLKQLTRHSIYKNTYDAAADSKFKSKSPKTNLSATFSGHNGINYKKKTKRKYNKYTITDIFASNSSFILDHEYNEDDICNLILNSSTQSQTKIKFLKSIWRNILRVTTRVLNGSKFRCPICLDENISIGRITECGHCFCGTCLLHHLFSSKTNKNQLVPEVKDDDNYNFTDLFGHCPLCHEYVSYEQCRPLTVIRCQDYKVNDNIDMVLIERRKGEQPIFSANYRHNHDISTFRKFEIENEITICQQELIEINKAIKSSDPIYEEPFLRLLAIQVKQYKSYIIQQREEYNIISPKYNNNDNTDLTEFKSVENSKEIYYRNDRNDRNDKKEAILAKPSDSNRIQQQIYEQQQQSQQRYRKKKYVYQSADGQLLFLHPHNYNMLKHDTNYIFNGFPSLLSNCKILQIENYQQSYDLRRRYPFLGFIPVDVSFSFIEVDLSSIVSKSTSKYFEKQSLDRKQFRVEKEKLVQEEKKHKKIMEEQRVAIQKQKYARPQIDINDYSEFPSLSTPSKSLNNDSNSDCNNSDNSNHSNNSIDAVISNKNRKSAAQRSWSQITIKPVKQKSDNNNKSKSDSPHNNNNNNNKNGGSGNKKKRRRGRNKKRGNKNKENNIKYNQ